MEESSHRFPSYRSSYLSRSSGQDEDSALDVSLRSHHNFLQSRDKQRDMENDDWPVPESLGDDAEEDRLEEDITAYSYPCEFDDCYEDESCLCAGVTLLANLLCSMYSKRDDDKEIQIKRPTIPSGSKLYSCSRLLSMQMANDLYDMIPETSRISPPTLLFATYRDGWSMESLLAKTIDKEPVILLIKASDSQVVLGAYSTAKLSPPSTRVRGNGECFVFRLSQPSAAYRWTYVPSMKKASQNQFVVSCRDYISFGASQDGGNNAIRLDNDLRYCDSGSSDTYQNEPLVTEELNFDDEGRAFSSPFEVLDIEVIHVCDGRRRRGARSSGR